MAPSPHFQASPQPAPGTFPDFLSLVGFMNSIPYGTWDRATRIEERM